MSVNPKTLVEKFIRDSKVRKRFTAVTGLLAVFTVLITVGVLTFPAISISGSEEALREQGIDITTGQPAEEAEVVAPPADEAPIVAYDEASQALDAESSENVAEAITEETQIGDVVVSGEENAEAVADAPAEGEATETEATEAEAVADAPAEGEEASSSSEAEENDAKELDPEKAEAEKEIEASDAAKNALAAADLSSQRLIVGTSNVNALAEDENLVANFDNVYLLQYASTEDAAKGFLTYYDTADYVTPDVAVEIAEGEDNSDPEEEIINTDNVYTEEENPFAELETALVEETTAEADAAAESSEIALIAMIDTGAELSTNVVEAVSMLGSDPADDNGHGQRMVDFIVAENEEAQILSIKALGADGKGDVSAVVAAINYAKERGASIINLSMSAYASEENAALAEAVKAAEEAGIVVVGAAGNNGFNAKFYIPGNIDEATIVGAADAEGARIAKSNFGETVDYNVVAESTSEAAARMSGFVSANGEAGIEEALDQGFVFSTGYVAPAVEEETEEGKEAEEAEETEKAEEGKEAEEATPKSKEDTDTQLTAADNTQWEALRSAINGAPNDTEKEIKITGDLIADSTIVIPANKKIKLVADSAKTIYRKQNAANFPVFEVLGELTVGDNITMTGQQATIDGSGSGTVTATRTASISNGDEVLIEMNGRFLQAIQSNNINFTSASADSIKSSNDYIWVISDLNTTNKTFTLKSKAHSSASNPYVGEKNLGTSYAAVYNYGSSVHTFTYSVQTEKEGDENVEYVTLTTSRGTLGFDTGAALYKSSGSFKGAFYKVEKSSVKAIKNVPTYNSGLGGKNGFFAHVSSGGTFNLTGSATLTQYNTTAGNVAPVYVASGGTMVMSGGTITDNRVQNDTCTAGAIINDGGDVTISDGVISANQGRTAGAIYNKSGNLTITGGEIKDHTLNPNMRNWAPIKIDAGKAEISGGTISGNTGMLPGGGSDASRVDYDTQKSSTHQNENTTYVGSAGAIRINGGEVVLSDEADISGNRGDAGAIWVSAGTLTMNGGTISGNNGYDGVVRIGDSDETVDSADSTFMFNGGTIDGNSTIYWGTVLVKKDGKMIMGRGDVIDKDNPPTITNNKTLSKGGAIYVNSNHVYLIRGEIANNTAAWMGGGVYVSGDSTENLSILTMGTDYDKDGNVLQGTAGVVPAYIYDNTAAPLSGLNYSNGAYWPWAGMGGGIWYCKWSTVLYDQSRVIIDRNSVDSSNGVDVHKMGGSGMIAEWKDSNNADGYVNNWYKGNGEQFGENSADTPYYDGIALENKAGENGVTSQGALPDTIPSASTNLLIHDNQAQLGGGMGLNGIITFRELPVYKKVTGAEFDLTKQWVNDEGNGNLDVNNPQDKAILNDRRAKFTVTFLHESNPDNPLMRQEFMLGNGIVIKDGNSTQYAGLDVNEWKATITLPTYDVAVDPGKDGKISEDEWAAAKTVYDLIMQDSGGNPIEKKTIEFDPSSNSYDLGNGYKIVITEDVYFKKSDKNWPYENNGPNGENVAPANADEQKDYEEQYEALKVHDGTFSITPGALTFERKTGNYSERADQYNKVIIRTMPGYKAGTTLTNDKEPTGFGIKVIKTDTASKPLGGAKFRLYKLNGETKLYATGDDTGKVNLSAWTANADSALVLVSRDVSGDVYFSGLTKGTYYVEEFEPPVGYMLDTNNIRKVVIERESIGQDGTSSPITNISFTNEEIVYPATMVKTGSGGNILPNVQFRLKDADGKYAILGSNGKVSGWADAAGDGTESDTTIWTTNDQGKITFESLRPGTYTLEEVAAPTGYAAPSENVGFTVSNGGAVSYAGTTVVNRGAVSIDDGKLSINKQRVCSASQVNKKQFIQNLAGASVSSLEDGQYYLICEGKTKDVAAHWYLRATDNDTIDYRAQTDDYTYASAEEIFQWKASTINGEKVLSNRSTGEYLIYNGGSFRLVAESDVLSGNIDEVKVINQEIFYNYKLYKTNAQGQALPGAVFRIYYLDGTTKKYAVNSEGSASDWVNPATDSTKWTVPSGGVLEFKNLVADRTYFIEEVSAPESNVPFDGVISFSLARNGEVTYKGATPNVSADAQTGQLTVGGEKIYANPSGDTVAADSTITTTPTAYPIIVMSGTGSNAAPVTNPSSVSGNVYLRAGSTNWYLVSTSHTTVGFSNNTNQANWEYFKWRFTTVNDVKTFYSYYQQSDHYLRFDGTTGSLVSDTAALAYTNSGAVAPLSDGTANVQVKNTEKTYSAKLKKTGQGDAALGGAKFQVYKMDGTNKKYAINGGGSVIGWVDEPGTNTVWESGTDGMLNIAGLNASTTYYAEETQAPAGYGKYEGVASFTISTAGVVTYNGAIDNVTVDPTTGYLMMGGKKLYAQSDNNEVSSGTPIGTTPTNYPLIVVERANQNVNGADPTDNVVYSMTSGTIYAIRIGDTGYYLQAQDKNNNGFGRPTAHNTGKDTSGFAWQYNVLSDGSKVLKNLWNSDNQYYLYLDNALLKQTKDASALYRKNTSGSYVTAGTDGSYDIKVQNRPVGWVKINKVDKDGQYLPGAKLIVVDTATDTVVWSGVSSTSAIKLELPVGSYQLVETEAPEGYLVATSQKFDITTGNVDTTSDICTVTMTDYTNTPGEIQIYKVDQEPVEGVTPAAVPGATLQLKNSSGVVIATWVTTSEPKVFSSLPPGKYTIVELEAPYGYSINKTVKEFTVETPKSNVSTSPLPLGSGINHHISYNSGYITVKASGTMNGKTVNQDNIAYCIARRATPDDYWGVDVTKIISLDASNLADALNSNRPYTSGWNSYDYRIQEAANIQAHAQDIKKALWIGYPMDAAGLMAEVSNSTNRITGNADTDFRKITQAVIWSYTNPDDNPDTGFIAGVKRGDGTVYAKMRAIIANSSQYNPPSTFSPNIFSDEYHQPVVEAYGKGNDTQMVYMPNEKKTGSVVVNKNWLDSDGQTVIADQSRLKPVTIQLWRSINADKSNATQVESVTITQAPWQHTFNNNGNGLDIVDPSGNRYYYFVKEVEPAAPFRLISEGDAVMLQANKETNVPTGSSTSSTWDQVTPSNNANTAGNMLVNGKTYVFLRTNYGTPSALALNSSGNPVYETITSYSPSVAPAAAYWVAEETSSGSGEFYLKHKNTGKYITHQYDESNEYKYSTTGTIKAKFKLTRSGGYYYLTCVNMNEAYTNFYSAYTYNIGAYAGVLSTRTPYNFAAYVQSSVTGPSTDNTETGIGQITVTNQAERYEFDLIKVDSRDLPTIKTAVANASDNAAAIAAIKEAAQAGKGLLTGAVFELIEQSSGSHITPTTENGVIKFTNLNPGLYTLKETTAPNNYQPNNTIWYVLIEDNGTVKMGTELSNNVPNTNKADGIVQVGNTGLVAFGNDITTYVLPATGGVGTEVFAIIGGLMMLVAGALWVRRTGRQKA